MAIVNHLFERPATEDVTHSLGNMMVSGVENEGSRRLYFNLLLNLLVEKKTIILLASRRGMRTMSDIAYERRKAVAEAWKNEKKLVAAGKGTRDWSQKEQREILSKGKAAGYQGHHMKSVDGHNAKAGESSNIQFLTRSEHLAAHKGNYRNNTNGYYDPATGKMNDFGRYKAHADPRDLSNPLSESQKKYAYSKAETSKKTQAEREKAKMAEQRSVSKTVNSESPKRSTESKTPGTTTSKTLANQRSSSSGRSSSGGKSSSSGKGTSHSH